MKRIAVLTSGGDCSGMNAAIRAVVRSGLSNNLEVIGIQKGYQGLIDQQHELLTTKSVSGKLQVGGTFLQSARCLEMHEEQGRKQAVETLQEMGAEGLIVIGGDGSHRGAYELQKRGIPVIAIPASIDNDIPFTDMSLGVDTALNNILHAVDCLKDTASSHDRTFVVETMGRPDPRISLRHRRNRQASVTTLPGRTRQFDHHGRGRSGQSPGHSRPNQGSHRF
jgi:6-phosphofructokinase 1